MATPLIPWEPCNIPEEIQTELDRRRVNRSFEYVSPEQGGWENTDGKDGDWTKYRGPMSPWVRFCSNGAGKPNPYEGSEYFDKQGFVLFGGKDFYSSYGFLNPSNFGYGVSNPSIIGYMPTGIPHTIDNDLTSNYPIHVPPPEIEKISVTIQKELYRRATIEWVCFSPKQLEYMTPYFLVPGISCILEWGWNHFDPSSLLDLNDLKLLKRLKTNPYPLYTKHIIGSKGNYDVLFGVVNHFEWSIDKMRIRCKTEITSPDRIYAGLVVDSSIIIKQELETSTKDKENDIENQKNDIENQIQIVGTLRNFITVELPNIKKVITSPDPAKIPGGIGELTRHLQEEYPENFEYPEDFNWKHILYGVFCVRDLSSETMTTDASIANSRAAAVAGSPGPISPFVTKLSTTAQAHNELKSKYTNAGKDFDAKDQSNIWINMGLVFEIFNLKSKDLIGYNNESMFRVDINDCVIGAHPNLISTDGTIMLIPNAESPKYFYGAFGDVKENPSKPPGAITIPNLDDIIHAAGERRAARLSRTPEEDKAIVKAGQERIELYKKATGLSHGPPLLQETPGGLALRTKKLNETNNQIIELEAKIKNLSAVTIDSSTTTPSEYDAILGISDSREDFRGRQLTKDEMEELGLLPDLRLWKICYQKNVTAYRDNLDSVINALRYRKCGEYISFAFPFFSPQSSEIENTKSYPRRYAGRLRDIYVRVGFLQDVMKKTSLKTFTDFIGNILADISTAAANMWDLRLTPSTGKAGETEVATMKVVDYKFVNSINYGKVYTFDYFDAESLLQSIRFTPTISNPQAIRTMYAETNNPNNRTILSDQNELLDYQFKDRLRLDNVQKPPKHKDSQTSLASALRSLQLLTPANGAMQMSIQRADDTIIVKRMVLPSIDILKLLLDDGDMENNPRYCGIMPNIQAQFTIQGVGGLRTFMMFLVRNLPEPYSHRNIVFRIIDLTEDIEAGKWTTTITAGILPLRKHVKERLGLVGEIS
jgi:hypothetical protein